MDGLPNWFEMYWFGAFLHGSTATIAAPKALGKDGKTNLQRGSGTGHRVQWPRGRGDYLSYIRIEQ